MRKLAFVCRNGTLLASLRGRPVASIEHDFLVDLDIAHVIDAGASSGQFSLLAQRCFGDIAIDGFEPLVEQADVYERYVTGPNVRLHRTALANREGSADFHVSGSADSSSLLEIGAKQVELFPETVEVDTIEVPITTLDLAMSKQKIERPSLLKIDVQGAELSLLEGAKGSLASIDYVFVELSFVELYRGQDLAGSVVELLVESGFQLRSVNSVALGERGEPIQADFLFAKRDATS